MSGILKKSEIKAVQKRQKDEIGGVFDWQGRIFRGIYPEYTSHIESLFQSGLIDELISKGLVPKSWITKEIAVEGYGLILEHERIWPVVYPQEWTFSMLQDAALKVYEVGTIAKKHGFNMKDCHGLNILFSGTSPMFIDLGSFVPDKHNGWMAYEEFLRFYYYPLNIWKTDSFLGKSSIFSANLVSHETYFSIQKKGWKDKIRRYRLLKELKNQKSPKGAVNKPGLTTLIKDKLQQFVPDAETFKEEDILERIKNLQIDKAVTVWSDYHDEIKEKVKRFERIISLAKGLKEPVKTAVDIGGNQGRFSRRLIDEAGFEHVVCADGDEAAIDAGYRRAKTDPDDKLTFAHFDFMGSIAKLSFALPHERFKADVVFVLALTHHLLLGQGYNIDDVLANAKKYANKYVFIEFMPLGLWRTGEDANVPDWYTTDWFRDAFSRFFNILHEEQLKDNNILFIGQI